VTGSSLPRKLEDLRGCLARRYVRVSSEEQGWKYGPDGQNLTIDEAIDRAGLQESGQPFLDEQSAWRNSDERPALQALLSAALRGQYKVLVVAYFSRWSRDAEVALRIRRELHAAGVALYFADEGFLSTDENAHERYLDEAIAAEKFSHRLSRTIKRTHAAKFERYGDQAGSPGLGFYRTPQPMARLAIDSDTMPRVIALYVRYARDDISYRALAREMGIAEGAIHAILTNPLYNGWAVRNRRSPDERRVAAPWRDDPPVSDELATTRLSPTSSGRTSQKCGRGATRRPAASAPSASTCWPSACSAPVVAASALIHSPSPQGRIDATGTRTVRCGHRRRTRRRCSRSRSRCRSARSASRKEC